MQSCYKLVYIHPSLRIFVLLVLCKEYLNPFFEFSVCRVNTLGDGATARFGNNTHRE
jgi:hypothetical protein